MLKIIAVYVVFGPLIGGVAALFQLFTPDILPAVVLLTFSFTLMGSYVLGVFPALCTALYSGWAIQKKRLNLLLYFSIGLATSYLEILYLDHGHCVNDALSNCKRPAILYDPITLKILTCAFISSAVLYVLFLRRKVKTARQLPLKSEA